MISPARVRSPARWSSCTVRWVTRPRSARSRIMADQRSAPGGRSPQVMTVPEISSVLTPTRCHSSRRSAKDDIEGGAYRPGGVHEIDPPETDHVLQTIVGLQGAVALPAYKMTPQQGFRDLAEALGVVNASFARGQYVGVYVGREDLDIPVVFHAQRFANRNGNGVRLFTCGAGSAPDSQLLRRPVLRPGARLGNHPVAQKFEVMVLPEEIGFVSGDAVDHLPAFGTFRRLLCQIVKIVAVRRKAQVSQTPRQPGLDQHAFGNVEIDPRLGQNQFPKLAEFSFGERGQFHLRDHRLKLLEVFLIRSAHLVRQPSKSRFNSLPRYPRRWWFRWPLCRRPAGGSPDVVNAETEASH